MTNKLHISSKSDFTYAAKNSLRLHPVQQKLMDLTMSHPMSIMMGSPDELQLFANLIRTIGAKKTLDVGVYTGCSALSVALALPADGKVVACDVSEEYTNLGKPFWEEAGVSHKIDLRIAPAAETLNELLKNGEEGTFDFAFIDADKLNYDTYYELCLKLIRQNGIIAIDNMLWGGTVYAPENTEASTVAIRALARKVHADERVNVSFLVIGDGTMLVFKK